MKYKFNTKKYITRGIEASIPIELQIFLWEVIGDLSHSQIELDYLQIFNISKTENMITVQHKQEEPVEFIREYNLLDGELLAMDIKDTKIYVIDNIDYSIMLLADEY